ncbi:MAG TPA: DUF11 domain-containing protein [Actinobacteria bacterium]|nr:DUF11 domain-containing protein [Actinomycetota bacterium]
MKKNSGAIGQGLKWALWRIRKPISVCLTFVLMIWVLAPAISAASNISESDHRVTSEKKKDSKKNEKSDSKHDDDKKSKKKNNHKKNKKGKSDKRDKKKDKKDDGKHDDDEDNNEKKDECEKSKKGDHGKKDKKDDDKDCDDEDKNDGHGNDHGDHGSGDDGDDDHGDHGGGDDGDSGDHGDDDDGGDGDPGNGDGGDDGDSGDPGDDGGDDGGDGGDGDDGHGDGGDGDPGDEDGDKDGDDGIPVEPPSTPAPERDSEDYEPPPPSTNKTHSVHIDKWDTVDPVTLGGTSQYYIRVYNNGKNKLTNVKVTDSLPGSFKFLSSSSGKSSWRLGTLPAGTSKTVWLVAKPGEVGKSFMNRATVTAKEISGGVSDSAYTDVVDEAATAAAGGYALAVSKTDNVNSVRVGNKVTYTITVKNQGTKALTNLTFKDWMPSGITYRNSTTTISRLSSGVYTWTTAKLDAGESRSYRVVTTAQKRGTWTNTVSVKADEIPADKLATEKTQILGEDKKATAAGTGKGRKGDGKAKQISGKSKGFSLAIPLAGVQIYLWWIVAFALLLAGIILEIRSRQNSVVTE